MQSPAPSQSDLVCLYLDALDDGVDDPATVGTGARRATTAEAPPRTVEGISSALDLERSATSQQIGLLSTLDTLEADGLVESDAPADGETTRPRYRLTEAGHTHAEDVRERWRHRTVTVTNGTTEEVAVEDLDRYFETFPLVRALAAVNDAGEIHLEGGVGGEFVDREAELERLHGALSAVPQQGSRTVLVSGEAGVGKTTLVERLLASAADEAFQVARGRCRRSRDRPYGPLIEAFEDLPDGASLVDPLETAAYEVEDPDAYDAGRAALFNEVADAVRDRAQDRPLALFLDDLQWAGTDTRDLFVHLTETVTEWLYPVLFVATYRREVAAADEGFDAAVESVIGADRTVHVELGPLPERDSHGLVAWVAGRPDLPESVVETVRDRAGGNPLLLRETVQQLLDGGPLDREDTPTTPDDLPVPSDATTVVESRLADLPTATREVLETAAVAGEAVAPAVVAAALDAVDGAAVEATETAVNDHLDVLVTGRFLERTGDGVAFVGGLVREAVVEGLAEDRRRTLHAAVAEAVRTVYADTVDERAARIAHHYERAGDHEQALAYYRRAGDRARRVYAHEDALETYDRALSIARRLEDEGAVVDLLEAIGETAATLGRYEQARERFAEARDHATDVATRQRLYERTGETYNHQGDFEAAIEAAETGLALTDAGGPGASDEDSDTASEDHTTAEEDAEPAGDDRETIDDEAATAEVAGLLNVVAHARRQTGDREAAREAAARARECARTAGAPEQETVALQRLGNVAQVQGDYEAAAEHLKAALERARDLGDETREAKSLQNLGTVAVRQGEVDAGGDYYEDALERYREIGDRQGESDVLHNLGFVAETLGDLDRAEDCYEESLAIEREIGDREGVSHGLQSLGRVASDRGDTDAAREYYEESLAIAREIGDRRGESTCLYNLGEAAMDRGDRETAREHFEESLAISREIGDRQGESASLHNLGYIAEHRGDLESAEERYERALSIQREIGFRQGESASLGSLGRVAGDRGDLDVAVEYLEESLAINREIGDRRSQATTLYELAEPVAARGDLDAAAEYLEESLEISREIDFRNGEAEALHQLGDVARARGDHETARERYEESLAIARDLDATPLEGAGLVALGDLATERGDLATAADRLEEGLALARDAEDRATEVEGLLARARLASEHGDHGAALEGCEDALSIATRCGYRLRALDALEELATVHERRGDPAGVRECCERALALVEEAGADALDERGERFRDRLADLEG